jgi:hypothetical protein
LARWRGVGVRANASKAGVGGLLERYRVVALAIGVILVGLVVFVLVWFQPQKLFLNQRVEESAPATQDASSVIATGQFVSLEHDTTGAAVLIELSNGSRVLRFDDLDTSNGPDLRVYLSEQPPGLGAGEYGEDAVDLGPLKGNIGDQNYSIPEGVDLTRVRTAVVWCRRFTVAFGLAPLEPGAP